MNKDKIYKTVDRILDSKVVKKENGTVLFFQDGSYYGESKKGKGMHGEGVLYYHESGNINDDNFHPDAVYIGEFKNGLPNSKQGYFKYKDRTEYIGGVKNSMWHGQGMILWRNEDTYTGNWKDNKEIGQGKFFKSHKNKLLGQGIFIYKNGSEYIGGFKKTKWSGKNGAIRWSNGDRYFGEIKKDLPDGKGTYLFKNEKIYNGELKNGKLHGKGVLSSAEILTEPFKAKNKGKKLVLERGIWKAGELIKMKKIDVAPNPSITDDSTPDEETKSNPWLGLVVLLVGLFMLGKLAIRNEWFQNNQNSNLGQQSLTQEKLEKSKKIIESLKESLMKQEK